MSTDEMRAILAALGWTQERGAAYARRGYARFRKMARGRSPIDAGLALWLADIVSAHRAGDQITLDRLLRNGAPPPPRDQASSTEWEPDALDELL